MSLDFTKCPFLFQDTKLHLVITSPSAPIDCDGFPDFFGFDNLNFLEVYLFRENCKTSSRESEVKDPTQGRHAVFQLMLFHFLAILCLLLALELAPKLAQSPPGDQSLCCGLQLLAEVGHGGQALEPWGPHSFLS
jgi:hypothetical protein